MMQCSGCSSTNDLYCPRCLGEGLNNHAEAHHILQTQLLASKNRCEKILYGHLPSTSTSASTSTSYSAAGSGSGLSAASATTSVPASAGSSTPSSTLKSTSTIRPTRTPLRLSSFLSQGPLHTSSASSIHSPHTLHSTRPPHSGSLNPGLQPQRQVIGYTHLLALSATNSRLSNVHESLEVEVGRIRAGNEEKRAEVEIRWKAARRRKEALRAVDARSRAEVGMSSDLRARTDHDPGSEVDVRAHAVELELDRLGRRDELTRLEIRRARKVLAKEVVGVFGVRACTRQGRASRDVDLNGRKSGTDESRDEQVGMEVGTEREMEIAGLRFPSPARFTGKSQLHSFSLGRYRQIHQVQRSLTLYASLGNSSNHLNAVLSHTLHLLHLLSLYLTIRLPFTWAWSDSPAGPAASTSKLGFEVYPASEAGRMIGKPVFTAGESLAFGRSVPLRRVDRGETRAEHPVKRVTSDDDAVFEDDDESDHGQNVGSDEQDSPDWADDEDLRLWRKKAVLYVSTSREKWKRRQSLLQPPVSTSVQPREKTKSIDREGPAPRGSPPLGEGKDAVKSEKQAKRDKYQVKEDQMILAYAMLCYDVACLAWMNGVDLADRGGDEVDWDRVLNPLRLIWESVESETLGGLSHTLSIPTTPPDPARLPPSGQPTISYIPLPFSFSRLVDKATEVFSNRDARANETKCAEGDLGGDDWDLV